MSIDSTLICLPGCHLAHLSGVGESKSVVPLLTHLRTGLASTLDGCILVSVYHISEGLVLRCVQWDHSTDG